MRGQAGVPAQMCVTGGGSIPVSSLFRMHLRGQGYGPGVVGGTPCARCCLRRQAASRRGEHSCCTAAPALPRPLAPWRHALGAVDEGHTAVPQRGGPIRVGGDAESGHQQLVADWEGKHKLGGLPGQGHGREARRLLQHN